jgi:hypothetical protein
MARKKATAERKPTKKMGRPALGDAGRVVGIHVRMTKLFDKWLEGFADYLGCDRADAITMGLARLARENNYEAPPRR